MIKLKNCSFQIQNKILINDVNISIEPNELVVVMGANGAGKSTLLKLISGSWQATKGSVFIEDKLISSYSTKQLSLKRAVLSQHYEIAFPLSVKEIVLMGRYPYFDNQPSKLDWEIVYDSMHKMEISHFADRAYQTLSGGEAQKVHMCRVLAQIWGSENQSKFLLLDEPVSHLDIKYQYHLLNIAKSMINQFTAVIAVLHDINLALKFADRILFMKDGEIVHHHLKTDAINPSIIKHVFDVDASIIKLEEENQHWVIFK